MQLSGWKQIAGHLKVDPKTAQRWEREHHLPVKRSPTNRVFATSDALDEWLRLKPYLPADEPALIPLSLPDASKRSQHPDTMQPQAARAGRRFGLPLAAFLAVSITAVALGVWLQGGIRNPPPAIAPVNPPPRITWNASVGGPIHLPLRPDWLFLSPKEDKLFAFQGEHQMMTIIDTATLSVTSTALPVKVQMVKPDPRAQLLLVGSSTNGFVILDAATGDRILGPIPTGGPVFDLAMTPDDDKVFLAMRGNGLKRWSRSSQRVDVITPQKYPSFLGLDQRQGRLFVSYQGGGPKGRPGHDSVEMFDTVSERSLGFLPDLPLVGGEIRISSDGTRMTIDGGDACRNPAYDWAGCPSSPSSVFHVFRLPEVSLLKTLTLPIDATTNGPFLPGTHALLQRGAARGAASPNLDGLSVLDLSGYRFRETLSTKEGILGLAIASHAGRVYAGTFDQKLLVFGLEPPGCGYGSHLVTVSLTADGIYNDVIGSGTISGPDLPSFDTGFVGQSLRFDGRSSNATFSSRGTTFGPVDSSLAAYIKLAKSGIAQDIVQVNPDASTGNFWSLGVTTESLLQLRFGITKEAPMLLTGKAPLQAGTWYFVVATRDAKGVKLYLDGELQSDAAGSVTSETWQSGAPFRMGGSPGRFFHGWLDEFAILTQSLSPEEVAALYRSRINSPCKPY